METIIPENSIKQEANDNADFKAYSDGSGFNEGIGAAAALYSKGSPRPIGQLKKYLGPLTEHNTYEAETAGALLATWLISKNPDTIGKKVSLYIDNQSVISAIRNPKATSGQHLTQYLNLMANSLNCYLAIRWISSHSEVKGNEKVNSLAKEAASGRSSRSTDIPPILRSSIPISASATKQGYLVKLKNKWAALWAASDRSGRATLADDTFPYNSSRRRFFFLSRNQASIIMQIRSGHIPLKRYLYNIKKTNSDICQDCEDEENGIHCRETVNHFIFECPAHEKERDEMLGKIKRSNFNFKDIMSNTDYMKALANYVNNTERLKRT
jgi:ribonuclease HI